MNARRWPTPGYIAGFALKRRRRRLPRLASLMAGLMYRLRPRKADPEADAWLKEHIGEGE